MKGSKYLGAFFTEMRLGNGGLVLGLPVLLSAALLMGLYLSKVNPFWGVLAPCLLLVLVALFSWSAHEYMLLSVKFNGARNFYLADFMERAFQWSSTETKDEIIGDALEEMFRHPHVRVNLRLYLILMAETAKAILMSSAYDYFMRDKDRIVGGGNVDKKFLKKI